MIQRREDLIMEHLKNMRSPSQTTRQNVGFEGGFTNNLSPECIGPVRLEWTKASVSWTTSAKEESDKMQQPPTSAARTEGQHEESAPSALALLAKRSGGTAALRHRQAEGAG